MENQDDALCVRRGITDGLSGQQAPELHCHLPRVGCERAGREGVTGTLRGEGEPVLSPLRGGEVASHWVHHEGGGLDSGRLWTC